MIVLQMKEINLDFGSVIRATRSIMECTSKQLRTLLDKVQIMGNWYY